MEVTFRLCALVDNWIEHGNLRFECKPRHQRKSETSKSKIYNAHECHLLELPPELRNIVWEYALPAGKLIEVAQDLRLSPDQNHAPFDPPLTLSCNIIREETLPMMYARNIFLIRGDGIGNLEPRTQAWLAAMKPHHRCALNHLCLRYQSSTLEDVAQVRSLFGDVRADIVRVSGPVAEELRRRG